MIGPVVGFCASGDEPSGSGAMSYLVSWLVSQLVD
jgi:hypothetical protein